MAELVRADSVPGRTVTMTIWSTPDQRARADRAAQSCGMTRAQFLRECINAGSKAA